MTVDEQRMVDTARTNWAGVFKEGETDMSKLLPWMPKQHRGARLTYLVKRGKKYGSSHECGSQSPRTAETDSADWNYYEAVTRPFAAGFESEELILAAQILTED